MASKFKFVLYGHKQNSRYGHNKQNLLINQIQTQQAGIELGLNQAEIVSLELTNQVQNKVSLILIVFVIILLHQHFI